MLDYRYTKEDDRDDCVPCSQLPTARINDLLGAGIRVVVAEGPEVGDFTFLERGLERLRIELVIRELEGRL